MNEMLCNKRNYQVKEANIHIHIKCITLKDKLICNYFQSLCVLNYIFRSDTCYISGSTFDLSILAFHVFKNVIQYKNVTNLKPLPLDTNHT